jgi:DNA-binding response OmpR family regulator
LCFKLFQPTTTPVAGWYASWVINVLLVEDDVRLAAYTKEFLEQQGLAVVHSADGRDAISQHASHPFDIVLLDLGLPHVDGFDVVRRMRERAATPIIMVTARDAAMDKVLGLELGADDYLTKPFEARELIARIRAVLRRGQGAPLERFASGGLVIDFGSREVSVDGARVVLTTQEFDLLAVLARRAGRVLSRDQLLEALSGPPDEVFDRAIDVRMSRLRTKLEVDPRKPRYLKTVRGTGYMLAIE